MLDRQGGAAQDSGIGFEKNKEFTMQVVLRRYGNSTVAVLPPAVLKDLGLAAGQAMTLDTTDRGEILLAPKRKYVLADLIAQCNPMAPPPADLALWGVAKPAGQEVW
jgi:antitoxin ChpS